MLSEANNMLTEQVLESILRRIPELTIGVLGDLFLDRYLDIDASLTEPSLETGLDAYQVVRVRSYPGAAGTVINNLAALGVKKVHAFSVIGDDGEGYELLRELEQIQVVDRSGVFQDSTRRTPTYTKPMLHNADQPALELNRMDIKNRSQLSAGAEEKVLSALNQRWKEVDTLIVSDQVSEVGCGVITDKVRNRLAELGDAEPEKVILVDSRERIGQFKSVWLKPNVRECVQAVEGTYILTDYPESYVFELARRVARPVFCTLGEQGVLIVDHRSDSPKRIEVPAYPVTGPIDIVGAGDSVNAAIACALAAGTDLGPAAAFGCLVASITIQQIGITGTASPEQIRMRWHEVKMHDHG
jgi:rfaE bifunctional protein kinase chain/domain